MSDSMAEDEQFKEMVKAMDAKYVYKVTSPNTGLMIGEVIFNKPNPYRKAILKALNHRKDKDD